VNKIQIFEHDWLKVEEKYISSSGKTVVFTLLDYLALAKYITKNPSCPFYTVYLNRIKFNQFVGVIKVGNLTIEVLPKSDNHNEDKVVWQNVLIQMLRISLKVEAKTTTQANINLKKHTVLESYLNLFIDEVDRLIHYGLTKKYRVQEKNQSVLKGKLLIHKHITKNTCHHERFFVSHQIYDQDNIYNSILKQTLNCIQNVNVSYSLSKRCQSIQIIFPECTNVSISQDLFQKIRYDRKTEKYRKAIELAKIILLNYHPDIKGGKDSVLAIMFNMNLLWEDFIYNSLKRTIKAKENSNYTVEGQTNALFWKAKNKSALKLKPDIILTNPLGKKLVIDTKWKYKSNTSVEDVRQMFAYGKYFNANRLFLLYPENIINEEKSRLLEGQFYKPKDEIKKLKEDDEFDNHFCGLLFVDPIQTDGLLNLNIGKDIIKLLDKPE